MSGLSRWTTLLVVAFIVPSFAGVLSAQDEKKAAGAAKPAEDAAKPDEAKKEAKAAARPAGAVTVVRIGKPAAQREDILARAVRAIEKAVANQPVAVERMVIAQPAMRIGAPVAADPDMDPMAAQWLAQFTPMVRTEVHFLLTVSQATPEQRKAIGSGRNKAAKEASKLYAQSQQRIGRFQNSTAYPQPRALVQESVTSLAKPVLSNEQMERYKAEVTRREDDQKSLAIKNIVARMDQDLVLSADQRGKLEDVLAKNWNASWCQSLETFMYGDQFFPAIPDTVVLPVLNPKQATVWRGTQKNNGMVFGGFGVFNGMADDNIFPDDEEPQEPKKDAAKALPGGAANIRVFVKAVAGGVELKKEEAPKADAVEQPKDAPKEKDPAKTDAAPKSKS